METLAQNPLHLVGLKEQSHKPLRVYISEEILKIRHITPQKYRPDEHIIGQKTWIQKVEFKRKR